jgi:hypothetical protein
MNAMASDLKKNKRIMEKDKIKGNKTVITTVDKVASH